MLAIWKWSNGVVAIFLEAEALGDNSELSSSELVNAFLQGLEELGFGGVVGDDLTKADLFAALQAAIWHFTDDVDLDSSMVSSNLASLYDLLTSDANPGFPEPLGSDEITVSISPEHITGEAGTALGPFTVSTTAEFATVHAATEFVGDPLPVIDADGNEVEPSAPVFDSEELFVEIEENLGEGSGTISVLAETLLPGRALIANSQSADLVIFGGMDFFTAQDFATLAWSTGETGASDDPTDGSTSQPSTTPAANGSGLAETGAGGSLALAAAGILLVTTGTALLFALRRRQTTT